VRLPNLSRIAARRGEAGGSHHHCPSERSLYLSYSCLPVLKPTACRRLAVLCFLSAFVLLRQRRLA